MEAMESSEVVVVSPEISEINSKSKSGQGSKSNTGSCQKYYKQSYRTSWESQPDFKGWLRGVEGQPSRAYCSYCQVTLFAHRLSLLKHTCTRKHQKAAHRIFLKRSEKGGSGTEDVGEDNDAEDGDIVEDSDPKTDSEPNHVVNNESVERLDPVERVDVSSNVRLRLKPKSQPASGMTVTIIREDGTTDPLHLEVTDYTDVQEPSSQTVPVSVVESAQTETTVESSGNMAQSNVENNHAAVEDSTMAQSRPSPLTTHVLDTSRGAPVHGIKVSLYRLIDGRWTLVNESITSPDGRCNELIEKPNFVSGRYKLHFDVDRYFEFQRQESMYPFVEIVFDVHAPQVHYHIPLLISPYGYTTYRGS